MKERGQSPARILVVDDEPEIVAFIRELLTYRGYEVLGFSDSRQASVQFRSFRPVFLTAQDESSLAVDLEKRCDGLPAEAG
jgi:DNA-binding response OmpR family regulator